MKSVYKLDVSDLKIVFRKRGIDRDFSAFTPYIFGTTSTLFDQEFPLFSSSLFFLRSPPFAFRAKHSSTRMGQITYTSPPPDLSGRDSKKISPIRTNLKPYLIFHIEPLGTFGSVNPVAYFFLFSNLFKPE